jgi:hypothetical protein
VHLHTAPVLGELEALGLCDPAGRVFGLVALHELAAGALGQVIKAVPRHDRANTIGLSIEVR